MLNNKRNKIQKVILLVVLGITILFADQSDLFAGGGENEQYLAFAEKMPEPEGGMKAIIQKIEYPQIAKQAGIQGKVFLLAFIDESGTVQDVKVIKGLGGGCSEAAIEAVKKTKFKPGLNKGQPVKVKLSLPIIFKL